MGLQYYGFPDHGVWSNFLEFEVFGMGWWIDIGVDGSSSRWQKEFDEFLRGTFFVGFGFKDYFSKVHQIPENEGK